ncbi:OmpA family protein [Sulfuritalea sp.]|uniref:OmpA family protein n=1 Tax=Sulfuritalea sp. TaxID=2480090 RepID=UPI001AC15436|nr:OmpA family protein [Sulfuritalea sp.]MBN8475898.1 OmpA family protein [Sulfuritalea sp.]
MFKSLVVAALSIFSLCGVAFAADDDTRQTASINTPNPKVDEVEGALFPKEIVALKDECAQMEKIGLRCQGVIPKSSLDTIQVTFARGSAILTDEGKGFLRSVGAALQRKSGVWKSLLIEGHTDATGSEATNRRLSKSRADSVKTFLQAEFGLGNIETAGRSSDKLRDADNPSGALNRRVEFVPNW